MQWSCMLTQDQFALLTLLLLHAPLAIAMQSGSCPTQLSNIFKRFLQFSPFSCNSNYFYNLIDFFSLPAPRTTCAPPAAAAPKLIEVCAKVDRSYRFAGKLWETRQPRQVAQWQGNCSLPFHLLAAVLPQKTTLESIAGNERFVAVP